MADFGAIFQIVSRGSALALEFYKLAPTTTIASGTTDISRVAKSISNFSSTVKQIGTIIKEDDSLPSAEVSYVLLTRARLVLTRLNKATETLEDILEQCDVVLIELQSIAFDEGAHHDRDKRNYHIEKDHGRQLNVTESAKFLYLQSHLEALKTTLLAMQQTLYTAQSITWAK